MPSTFRSPLFIATTPFSQPLAASSPAPVDNTLSPARMAFDSAPNLNTPMSLPVARGVFTRRRSISRPPSDIGSEPFAYILSYDGLPVRSLTHEVDPLSIPLPSSFLSTVGLKCQDAEPCDPVFPGGPNPFGAIGQGRPRSTSPRHRRSPRLWLSPSTRPLRFDLFRDWDVLTTPPLSPATSTCSSVDSIEVPPLPEVLASLKKLLAEPKPVPFIAPIPAPCDEDSAPISMWARIARAKAQEVHVAWGENAAGALEVAGEHTGWSY
ncbi:hypothetical protein BOTBODRAFT_145066 [Botryobasidium botryosum FD-172 SS1]|uniref:Uncharacterized protein n=1 Tax=Botryobasidium botryosum (strain FD-172 SS1) TaxID=930990 RepID=A0A067MLU1_BOTB1|nr:hypothetical protein BOTBODRAFT_145066 [Botryobasidium botryosum FD-172 SS1]